MGRLIYQGPGVDTPNPKLKVACSTHAGASRDVVIRPRGARRT
jgi:hypothetical protein